MQSLQNVSSEQHHAAIEKPLYVIFSSLPGRSRWQRMQGASPMASRLSSQHASHSSTPAHTFTGMSAAPTTSMLPKVQPQEQQEPAQQNGVQMMQVSCRSHTPELWRVRYSRGFWLRSFVLCATCLHKCVANLSSLPHSKRTVCSHAVCAGVLSTQTDIDKVDASRPESSQA